MGWNSEATLDEMLADEIVRLLMRRDGVSEDEVRRVMRRPSLAEGRPGAFGGVYPGRGGDGQGAPARREGSMDAGLLRVPTAPPPPWARPGRR